MATGTMLRRPADSRRDRFFLITALAFSSIAALAMLAFRVYYTGQRGYLFMPWNLFLAWLPLGFAAAAVAMPTRTLGGRAMVLGLGCLWLLFLPNAPYLVTEFKHLSPGGVSDQPFHSALLPRATSGRTAPHWFDVLLVMSFAWNGLVLGFLSLYLVHRTIRARLGLICGWLTASAALMLSGFGVTLGRFQRWNSWDLFARPMDLLSDIRWRALDPLDHPRTLGATLGLGLFLLMAYLTLIAMMSLHRSCEMPAGGD